MSHTDFTIPTYIINLPERTDRRRHVLAQFEGKSEFDTRIIEAVRHPIGAVGLWESMLKAVRMAIENDDDVMIICEDDHIFTPGYSKEYLLNSIIQAHEAGANLLLGGIAAFSNVIQVCPHLWWVDSFWSTQFVVVYRKFFDQILNEPFEDTDTADGKFSVMTSNKMLMVPAVSGQFEFGYSDVSKAIAAVPGLMTQYFRETDMRLENIINAKKRYAPFIHEFENTLNQQPHE